VGRGRVSRSVGIGVILGATLMVVAAALAPTAGHAGAADSGGGAAEVSIGRLGGPDDLWGFGAIVSGLLPLAGGDVVGTASFGICCIYPSAQSGDTVQFSLPNTPFTGETESGASIAGTCGGSVSAFNTDALETATDSSSFPTVSFQLMCTAAIAGGPASSFSLDIEGSEAVADLCELGGVPALPSCIPTGYGVYTAEPS
jgi:hypothetical protein